MSKAQTAKFRESIKKEIMEREKSIYDVLIHIEPEGDHLKSKDA